MVNKVRVTIAGAPYAIATTDSEKYIASLAKRLDEDITKLLDTGYAYFAGGNVYFDTSKLQRYYIFNDHNEEDLAVGVREGVEEDTNKRNKNDFVLWFTKSKFEDQALKWDSPWGVGYPGWHIECSGISMKYNGEYLDLHCGGVDNAFPHHTNEIAQSESYLGHPWCPQWCHVAHLNTSSGKMSKSKGEFLTVSLLEEKGYDPLSYRFFCLQSHYRKSLVFSWENLDNATVAYNKLLTRIAALKDEGEVEQAAFDEYKSKFMAAMDNDLNTSMAVTVLYDVLKAKTNDKTKLALLDSFDTVLGLKLLEKAAALRAKQAAAPTAGLHFTQELLERIRAKGVKTAFVTLHVGLGTFRPVKAEDVLDHHMHSEFCMMSAQTAKLLNETHQSGHRIVCVGTTSCRTLESVADENGVVHAKSGYTDIFITPGYRFKAVDGLITNFHLPESTLLMLVSALCSREEVMAIYAHAVEERYRFFSCGDAMFIS